MNTHTPETQGAIGVSESPSTRLVQIDGLRALAALSVVFFHYTTQFERNFNHTKALSFEFVFGYLGVNLFFVISGFVIYMTLDKIHAPLDFVVSRFSRLFPAYWTAIILTWGIVTIVGLPGYSVTWREAVFNFTMLQSFFSLRDVDGVYWSLQVELVFYVWMLVLWVTKLFRYSMEVFTAWVMVALAVTILEAATGIKMSFTVSYFFLLKWIPWFAIGIAIYVTLQEHTFKLRQNVLLIASLLAIAARNETPATILAVVSFFAVYGASRGALTWLAWKPLVFFGGISYPLYLVHEKMGWLIILHAEKQALLPWLSILLAVTFSVCVATILHSYIEMPCSKAIRTYYRRSRFSESALSYSRTTWAMCGLAAIICCALALIVTARIERADDKPRVTVSAKQMKMPRAETIVEFVSRR